MDFPKWLCMLYIHRLFYALYICHDPILDIVEVGNVYLILSPHKVFHADQKMKIMGTELFQMTL